MQRILLLTATALLAEAQSSSDNALSEVLLSNGSFADANAVCTFKLFWP